MAYARQPRSRVLSSHPSGDCYWGSHTGKSVTYALEDW